MLKSISYAAVVVALLSACKNSSPNSDYEKSESGLYSKFFITNEGARKPKTGEYASITVQYLNDKDSVLFNSASIKESKNGIISQAVFGSTFKGSFEEALMSMGEGDSASFKISADSVYLKTFGLKELPPYVAKGSLLTFFVKMHGVKTQHELLNELNAEETKSRNEFIAKNNITNQPSASGLIIVEQEPGTGEMIKSGQVASVKYTGKFLNGSVFDASDMHDGKPFDVNVGKGEVIPGWDEALQKMKKGGKAMLVIPSSLAYGAQGSGPIPPYSSLVFDLEIIDVK